MHDDLDLDLPQITAFWTWLQSHSSDLNALTSPDDPFWDLLLERIQNLNPGLWFELATPGEEDRELVITAQGDWELFPLVEALIEMAPEMQGWTFVALKPPMGFDFGIRYEGLDLDPASMWFEPLVDKDAPQVLGLRIAVPNFTLDQEDNFGNGLLLILDTALGEKSAATDVDLVEVCELPEDPTEEGFLPLTELSGYVEWRRNRSMH